MREIAKELEQASLFAGLGEREIEKLLGCLGARQALYRGGDLIVSEGDEVETFGILLSGHARSLKWDACGREIILTLLQKGSEIGVMLAAGRDHKSPVTVQAQDEVRVLHVPFEHVFARCEKACPCHDRLLRNYVRIVAEKGLVLHERINCLLRPTVREKILVYLRRASGGRERERFTIPLDRNGMAQYLNVERSALSRELARMRRDGLIEYHRSTFCLL